VQGPYAQLQRSTIVSSRFLKRAQNLDVISVPQEPLECHPKTEDRFMIRRLPEKVCESGFEIVPFVVETF
jgi:hypothetical protein